MNVYAPVWFEIKSSPSIADGARHLWSMIEKSRNLPNDLKNTVNDVIQHNGFFAHSENSLIAMVTDLSPVIRTLGWRRVKKARSMEGKRAERKQDSPSAHPAGWVGGARRSATSWWALGYF